ncbi:NAD(+) kinase [Idiomarina piscisalsi]|uniref:NAD kinase n=1 Tax=Idiomarina piscisalsi TaxID=1096243 RepID=A0A432YVH4_9GAMM|nr:NAD(+) kinase [Idiomarina piscisalsi]RUO67311.1 NAD(+) kinase [Idiomarina piscisalsi]
MSAFQRIGLLGKVNDRGTQLTLETVTTALNERGYDIALESRTAEQLPQKLLESGKIKTINLAELGEWADIAVVVGGDGNMLGAARALCEHDIGVIGVNRGNLGFLTDLDPDEVMTHLLNVLEGEYRVEKRFLLSAEVISNGSPAGAGRAINEIVLHSDKVAHMIEFELYIDDHFVFSQRSDGLICATPTGSTAYSLSGGGPILHPNLNAMTLVPMFPHTLSSRPIVVDGESDIRLRAAYDNDLLQISCDGHVRMAVHPGDDIVLKKHDHTLKMIHPVDHNYYHVLRNKLGWGSRLF